MSTTDSLRYSARAGLIVMNVFIMASCTVERLPALPAVRTQEGNWTRAVANCPPLPTKGEDRSVALFVTKQGTPFRLCARLYNGLSSLLFVSSGMMRGAGPALHPVNVSARFRWWWFCDQLGARSVLPVAAGVRVDPGTAIDFLPQPSCYGEGFTVPGSYQVLVHYETSDAGGGSTVNEVHSATFALP